MKKALAIFSLLLILFSCKEEPKPLSGSVTGASAASVVLDEDSTVEELENYIDTKPPAVPNLSKTGIKATLKGYGKTVLLTYDHKTKDIRIEGGEIPDGVYMDNQGFIVVNVPKKGGWKRINLGSFMGQRLSSSIAKIISDAPNIFSEYLDTISEQKTDLAPIVDWPQKMTPKKLAKNPDFDKDIKNCQEGSTDICLVFNGIQNEANGVVIYFDIDFRLQHIDFRNQGSVSYEYSNYDVKVPPAELLKL